MTVAQSEETGPYSQAATTEVHSDFYGDTARTRAGDMRPSWGTCPDAHREVTLPASQAELQLEAYAEGHGQGPSTQSPGILTPVPLGLGSCAFCISWGFPFLFLGPISSSNMQGMPATRTGPQTRSVFQEGRGCGPPAASAWAQQGPQEPGSSGRTQTLIYGP